VGDDLAKADAMNTALANQRGDPVGDELRCLRCQSA